MTSTLNLKKKKIISKREVIVIISAIILTTVGIKASDNIFNSEEAVNSSGGACPGDMVQVANADGDFCIDKYEASPSEDCPNSDPVNQRDSRLNIDYPDCQPVSKPGTIPWRFISQDQAEFACRKAGKRLPTNEEWFAAALGTPDPDSNWTEKDCHVSKNWPDAPGLTGSGMYCVSSSGAFDMIGNVWEWVKGTVNDGYFKDKKLPNSGFVDSTDGESFPGITNKENPNPNYNEDYFWIKSNGLRGIARGGYWDNKSEAGQYSIYIVTPPSYIGLATGFRCAK